MTHPTETDRELLGEWPAPGEFCPRAATWAMAWLTATQEQALSQPAEAQEPLFLLHTGQVDDSGEQGEWETESNSADRVEQFCLENPGKIIGLYARPAAQPVQVQVPEGWRLVPEEPTDDMLRRGSWSGSNDLSIKDSWVKREMWGRMLAAAPLPPAQPVGREPLSDSERSELERPRALVNTPTLHSFRDGVVLEAAHQRERWGSAHDAGKQPSDWFWLAGHLAGKALHAQVSGNTEKALHHTISTAAALANWHAAISGESTAMRPGIDPADHGITGEGV